MHQIIVIKCNPFAPQNPVRTVVFTNQSTFSLGEWSSLIWMPRRCDFQNADVYLYIYMDQKLISNCSIPHSTLLIYANDGGKAAHQTNCLLSLIFLWWSSSSPSASFITWCTHVLLTTLFLCTFVANKNWQIYTRRGHQNTYSSTQTFFYKCHSKRFSFPPSHNMVNCRNERTYTAFKCVQLIIFLYAYKHTLSHK